MEELSFSYRDRTKLRLLPCETKNRNSLSDLLKDVQRHHRMNLQNSILGSLFLRLD